MKTFLTALTAVALVAAVFLFFTFFLIVFAILIGLALAVLLVWWIVGTPFYITVNDVRKWEVRRFTVRKL